MSTRHSDLRKDKYNAMMCMFWLVSPDPGVNKSIPGLQLPNPSLTPVKGWESPLSRPSDHTKPAGLLAKGAGGLQRRLTTGSRGRDRDWSGAGRGSHPRAAAQPRAGPAVLGDGAGSGSSSYRALSAAAAWPCDRGKGKTHRRRRGRGSTERGLSCEQNPGSLTAAAPSPSAPFPDPTPPGASTRPQSAQPGPYRSPPIAVRARRPRPRGP